MSSKKPSDIDPLDRDIGERLRLRRRAIGMTQTALAAAMGVSFQQIQKYETGKNRVAGSTLIRLAAALKTTPGVFLGGEAATPEDELPNAFSGLRSQRARALVLRLVNELSGANETLSAYIDAGQQLLSALPIATYLTDARGVIVYFNDASVAFAGRTPRVGADAWCVTWRLFKLDGSFLPHDQCPMAIALKEDRSIRGAMAIAERPDGSRVTFTPYPTPLHDARGALIGGVNALAPLAA